MKTKVLMETNLGTFHIELYDNDVPETVKNFLKYVDNGKYDYTIIHRSEPGFVIQGGGYTCANKNNPSLCHIDTYGTIPDEYSTNLNFRGTIAMAKSSSPNSATSEWFINLSDANSTGLDGYTVFGTILDSGMDVVDDMLDLGTVPFYTSSLVFQAPTINGTFVFFRRVCRNDDLDWVCSKIEDLAPGRDGNGDEAPDSEQPNVTTFLTSLSGIATLAADSGMRFSSVTAIDKNTALAWLKGFTSPQNQTLNFNNGMLRFTAVGDTGADGKKTITLHDSAATRPNTYYAYGPTADNPTPHWYDFSYDGETGAKIEDNKIILYFADNKRGDDDYTTDNSITHTGAQAVATATTTGSSPSSGGCSIATRNPSALRAGDWVLVSLFLVFIELVRRRTRRNHVHRCSPDAGA